MRGSEVDGSGVTPDSGRSAAREGDFRRVAASDPALPAAQSPGSSPLADPPPDSAPGADPVPRLGSRPAAGARPPIGPGSGAEPAARPLVVDPVIVGRAGVGADADVAADLGRTLLNSDLNVLGADSESPSNRDNVGDARALPASSPVRDPAGDPAGLVRDPGGLVRDPGGLVRDPGGLVRDPAGPVRAQARGPAGPWRARVERLRAGFLRLRGRAYATPLGRLGVKIVVAVLGTLIIAVGVVLLPLPGPGWLIILGGLALLAMEFAWAKRLLRFTRAQLLRWTNLVKEGSWLVRIVSVGGLLLVVGGALLLSLRMLA